MSKSKPKLTKEQQRIVNALKKKDNTQADPRFVPSDSYEINNYSTDRNPINGQI